MQALGKILAQNRRTAEPQNIRRESSSRKTTRLTRLSGVLLVAVVSGLISGCPENAKKAVARISPAVNVTCPLNAIFQFYQCHLGLGLGPAPAPPGPMDLVETYGAGLMDSSGWGTLTADDIYIDTTGTTASLPSSGSGTLKVFGTSGQLLGAATFAWQRTGTKIAPANPASVQTWLEPYADSGVKVTYDLAPIQVPADGATVTVSNNLVINQVLEASDTYTFNAVLPPTIVPPAN